MFCSRAPPPPAWAQSAPTLLRLLTLLPRVPEVSNAAAESHAGDGCTLKSSLPWPTSIFLCVYFCPDQSWGTEVVASGNTKYSTPPLWPGSPSLPDKAKHNREVMILLPSHRERANNSMYYNVAENGQVGQNWEQLNTSFWLKQNW